MKDEKLMTARELAALTGRTYPEGQIRAAFHRAADNHPLPCVRFGAKRPVIKTFPSVFWRWLDEEMGLDEEVAAMDGGAGRGADGARQ